MNYDSKKMPDTEEAKLTDELIKEVKKEFGREIKNEIQEKNMVSWAIKGNFSVVIYFTPKARINFSVIKKKDGLGIKVFNNENKSVLNIRNIKGEDKGKIFEEIKNTIQSVLMELGKRKKLSSIAEYISRVAIILEEQI